MPLTSPAPQLYRPLLEQALREDLGTAGDLTTEAVVPEDARLETTLVVRDSGCLAGLAIAMDAFHLLDPALASELASLALLRGRHAVSIRHYEAAFAGKPELVDDDDHEVRLGRRRRAGAGKRRQQRRRRDPSPRSLSGLGRHAGSLPRRRKRRGDAWTDSSSPAAR